MCLCEHVKRVNYQVAIWKQGHVQNPEITSLTDDNGWVMVNRRIKPKWYEVESLPLQLDDILEDYNDADETDSGSDATQFSDRDDD